MNIIYGLIDKETNELRYIGKSVSGLERPKEHFKPCNLKNNSYKTNWIKQCLNKGWKPEVIILEEFNSPHDLFEAEIFWIAYYKGLGAKLTNLTNGGEGNIGWHPSEETKNNQRIAALNRDKTPYQNPHNKKETIEIDNIKYRNCCRCNQNKPLYEFCRKLKQKTYQGFCKSCNIVIGKEWREKQPKLSEQDYNASRLPGAIAGGEASKTPERRLQASIQRSKPIQGVHVQTNEIITFKSALEAKEHGFQNGNIGQAIKFNKPYRNYIWSFISLT